MTKHITLGVTGCIGAYKAILVLRGLQQLGATVEVVMTEAATRFIQPLTFQALSGKPVHTSHWGRDDDTDIAHIALAQRTHALVIAPATANSLARLAHGIADDFLSTVYLAATCPTFVAPAMNVEMWRHPATQENLARLRARGVHILEPEAGFLACGMVGEGRLADPDRIVDAVWSYLAAAPGPATPGGIPRDLTGDHVLVTAGPTIEDIDPVRYLTNRSSGKMGYAVARAAQARGATVTLVSGPTRLTPPEGVETIAVRSTREMYGAVLRCLPAATMVIKAAAVCDYRPRQVAVEKLKKTCPRCASSTSNRPKTSLPRLARRRGPASSSALLPKPAGRGRPPWKSSGAKALTFWCSTMSPSPAPGLIPTPTGPPLFCPRAKPGPFR
jgi:phosphopantothenoylcysteine decarboxylase/phosphopantothenate--cysteine ligase